MKIIIISDSHGHIENIKHVMGFAEKIKAEGVIHCGDWDSADAVEAVLSFKIPLYSVLGNADIDSEIEELLISECKSFSPHLLELNLDGKKCAVIHRAGAKDEKLFEFKVVFSGHYHSKEEKTVNWTKFVRPGAIINGMNFAVYETVTGEVEFFSDDQKN
jgi:putative phosphoesterase